MLRMRREGMKYFIATFAWVFSLQNPERRVSMGHLIDGQWH
jgi:hypothetical protein